jgi:ATP-dependent DNA helicase RecG
MQPVYPLTEGLSQATLRRVLGKAASRLAPELEDELPLHTMRSAGLLPKARAVREIHMPTDPQTLEAARRTLKYEELYHLHLAIALRVAKTGGSGAPTGHRARRTAGGRLRRELLRRLPFELTADQLRALGEIEQGLLGPLPEARLLQGDVGCGKTLVALLASLTPIEAGEQVALMAPTELLARQHAESAARLLEPLGVRVAFLTSSIQGPARELLLAALRGQSSGGVDLIVGTHALFSEDVRFRHLGFAVIDEQQRFGVSHP